MAKALASLRLLAGVSITSPVPQNTGGICEGIMFLALLRGLFNIAHHGGFLGKAENGLSGTCTHKSLDRRCLKSLCCGELKMVNAGLQLQCRAAYYVEVFPQGYPATP
jgi:hypothetical protein